MAPIVALLGVTAAALPIIAVLVLWIAAQQSQAAANCLYKLNLVRLFIANLMFSTDKKWKKQGDPERITKTRSKQVVLVRHGESAWNVVFNKGFGPTFPGRLGSALKREGELFPTLDSVFVDSPMSAFGANQAVGLQNFVDGLKEGDPFCAELKEGKNSVLASSNLRRALSTATIGFWNRMKRTQEKIHILSALQEITFNIDGVSISKPQGSPMLADDELKPLAGTTRADFNPERYYDCADNAGDKPVRGQGITRLLDFCAWVFAREEPTVIAAGHSLYFRFLFQTFLPHKSTHETKKSKMANCSVCAFTIWEGTDPNGDTRYAIDEDTIQFLHGELESKHGGEAKKE